MCARYRMRRRLPASVSSRAAGTLGEIAIAHAICISHIGPTSYMLSGKQRRKGVFPEHDVRMWREADKLADSGDYKGWRAIERELRGKGFARSKLLFDNDRTRDKFDERCKSAQEQRAAG